MAAGVRLTDWSATMTWHRLYVWTGAAFLAVAMFLALRAGDGGPVAAAALAVALVAGYRLASRVGR